MTQSKVPIIVLGVLIAALALIILPNTANFQQTVPQSQQVYTIQVGQSVPVPDGFVFTLDDLTPQTATFTIKKNNQLLPSGAQFVIAQPQDLYGLRVTYVSFTAQSARIEIITTAARVSSEAALQIFNDLTHGRYPPDSVKITEAACLAPNQKKICWVISGGKKETNKAGVVQTETGAVSVDSYEFIDYRVIYVDQSSGAPLTNIKST